MKIFITLFFILLFIGCSTTKPPVAEYKLNLKPVDFKSSSSRCKNSSIKVSYVFAPNSLASFDMNYGVGSSKVYAYSQSQWSDLLTQQITSQILHSIRDSELFGVVLDSKSRGKSDFILESSVEDFMQYYNKDLKSSYVKVSINITLIDAKRNIPLKSKSFEMQLNTKSLDAQGGVEALEEALEEVLKKNLKFLDGVCR